MVHVFCGFIYGSWFVGFSVGNGGPKNTGVDWAWILDIQSRINREIKIEAKRKKMAKDWSILGIVYFRYSNIFDIQNII
jgi:hypothetical protein